MAGLDAELDAHAELAFRIKDREIKKEIFGEIQDCKEKTFNIMEILRSS